MRLAEWMDGESLTNQAVAERIGCDRSIINKARNGRRIPRKPIIRALYFMSEGRVTPNDFYLTPEEIAAVLPPSGPGAGAAASQQRQGRAGANGGAGA